MATRITHSRSMCKPSVALLQTNFTDRSANMGDTPDPQSPDPCTPTPLKRINPLLSLLVEPISLQEELLALYHQMAVMQEKLNCAEISAWPPVPPPELMYP